MKITAILASLAIVATGAAAQVEEAAFNLGHYIKHNVVGISEEEAFKLGHYIAHNVVGVSEEENMSLGEMAKRYNKVKKFIPAEEEEVAFKNPNSIRLRGAGGKKVSKIQHTSADEEAFKSKFDNFYGPFSEEEAFKSKFDNFYGPFSEEEALNIKKYIKHNAISISEEEENMSLKEMAKRYNKVKKFIPVAEEQAFKSKFDNFYGPFSEEEALNIKNYIKHNAIGISEEEENMSLKEMAKRYNKVKKFIPVAEEQAWVTPICKGTVEVCNHIHSDTKIPRSFK